MEINEKDEMKNIFDNIGKLGFGTMRLPRLDENDDTSIDIETMKEMVDYFLGHGFTYFDTAVMYCGGKSQDALKPALTERYPRDKYKIATKLHFSSVDSFESRDKVFNEQLSCIGVDFFDYYLLHDLGSESIKIYEKFDCFGWLKEKKNKGYVKHMGFSYHDSADMLDKILTDHPEMEFVQLQLNYLDWDSQAVQSGKCYEVCVKHEKPVVVMEPVRGGTLTHIPEDAVKMFKEYAHSRSLASWAIRFAASHENVKVVLSGMSNMEQMMDNTGYMQDFRPFDETEKDLVKKAAEIINKSAAIKCTGCSYCTGGCPMNIAIPKYFSIYNVDIFEKNTPGWRPQQAYYDRVAMNFGKPGDCVQCGQCEMMCPQHLPIISYLMEVSMRFEN